VIYVLLIGLEILVQAVAVPGAQSNAVAPARPLLSQKQFYLSREAEVGVKITACAPGTSWAAKGAEAAVITLSVDGSYNQDIVLFAGSSNFTYRALLGRLVPGLHRLDIVLNEGLSAAGAKAAEISKVEVVPLDLTKSTDEAAISHAPFLFLRPNTIGRFSDLPLLAWYEVKESGGLLDILYSIVFTNEDAGTTTEALMARWGRATDIEWVYEVKLRGPQVIEEKFQGVNHRVQQFRGKKIANHPLLIVASDNNNFSDLGESAMRLALWPEAIDLSHHSREEVMDGHPWSYRLMAQELEREGKISEAGGHFIRDPRSYVYVEAYAPREGMGIDVLVRLSDGRWFDSDLGLPSLRITRGGWFRAAVRLPAGVDPRDVKAVAINCNSPGHTPDSSSACDGVIIQKVFRLDGDYRPRQIKVSASPVIGLKAHSGAQTPAHR
jgi:hypothetical protein